MRQIYIPRRGAGKAPELSREMRLIGEAARDGDAGGRLAALQMSQRTLKPHGACERLGRKTDRIEVLTLQLPRTQSTRTGERVNRHASAAIERHTNGMVDR